MANGAARSPPLAGADIHGFLTAADLNVNKLMGDASARWFRPNEVHALLSNYTYLKIEPQPVNMPPSGTVLLFDRKVLRNFRKDGHNWKKKKDGKTVQEAHEKLKIGSEERIHVYYARSEDDPFFFRRCYWLLDKNLERIVLVHYRQTSEDNVVDYNPTSGQSPNSLSLEKKAHHGYTVTPLNSNSCSTHSEITSSLALSEEINSGEDCTIYPETYMKLNCTGPEIHLAQEYAELQNHDKNLHDINTLNWEDLVGESACMDSVTRQEGDSFSCGKQMRYELDNSMSNGINLPSEGTSFLRDSDALNVDSGFNYSNQMGAVFLQTVKDQGIPSVMFESMNQDSHATDLHSNPLFTDGIVGISNDVFASQNSFGRMNYMTDDPPGSLDDLWRSTPIMNDNNPDTPATIDYSSAQQVFSIIDISPSWAYCTEDAKVLVIGHFNERHQHLEGSNVYCAFGEIYVPAEVVQPGVYRCTTSPQAASLVNCYLTFDGHTPISQVLSFEFRSTPHIKLNGGVTSSELNNVKFKGEDVQAQIKLAHLLFSTTDSISVLSSRIQSKSLKDAKDFASLTSPLLEKDWISLLDLRRTNKVSSLPNNQDLFELILKNKLQEWLLGKVAEGCKTTPRDKHGQGVIHLCATLDYTWSVPLFSLSGQSLDFRDSNGWTALHWAAYCGRERMVAALLSAGANPSLVTDPTSELPGGCTASDLASRQGYEGLAVYLAEKGLTAHFQAMSLSGNVSASIQTKSDNLENPEYQYLLNLSEQELCLKESLAAYRNAADAADRIQAAFRDRSLKLQTRAVQLAKPEMEAKHIIAAMRIQNAFRHHSTRKMMKAVARIQSHYRTWQTRKNFLHVRRQAIKIQAAFRGHQVRKQYRKITWSVGVLEKAILRWRLKRKGLRGIQVTELMHVETRQEGTMEEDFFQISREQAEDRVNRSVVRVQAMFRSYRAQQEYRRMKDAHEQAKVEYNVLMGTSNADQS